MSEDHPEFVRVFEPDPKSMRNSSIGLIASSLVAIGPVFWWLARLSSRSPAEGILFAFLFAALMVIVLVREIEARFSVTTLSSGAVEVRSAFRAVVLSANEVAGYSIQPSGNHIFLHYKEAWRPPVQVDRRILDERENLDWLLALPDLSHASHVARRQDPASLVWLPAAASAMAWISGVSIPIQFLIGVEFAGWIHAASLFISWSICLLTRGRSRLTTSSPVDDPRVSFWPSALLPVSLYLSAGEATRTVSYAECGSLAVLATLALLAVDKRLRNDFGSIFAHMALGTGSILAIRSAIGW